MDASTSTEFSNIKIPETIVINETNEGLQGKCLNRYLQILNKCIYYIYLFFIIKYFYL